MKAYTVPLSLAGALLALAGGLAHLLGTPPGVLPLVNLGLGLLLVVLAGVLNPELFRQYGRWLNAFWGSLMVLGIVAMLNFLSQRYHERFDLTAGKLHSLADLTVQTLGGLPSEVQALAFVEKGTDEKLEGLLKEYAAHGPRFRYELIDPDRDPERTQQFGVRSYGTLVLSAGDRQQRLTELTEKEITNALLKLARDRAPRAYLTVGHGEGGTGRGEQGLTQLRQRLEDVGFTVQDSLLLAREQQVPADCAVLLIAGPRTAFLANEVDAVRAYLDRGKAVIALLDPPNRTGLEPLLADWGVVLGDDFVIDTSGIGSLFGLDYTSPAAVDYGDHPITRKHRTGLMTFFELVRSVRFEGQDRGDLEGVELVRTSPQSWAETDLGVLQSQGKRAVRLDPGVDREGPVSLGVAVQGTGQRRGRLVVFGDADFATNRYFDLQANGDLVLNAVGWSVEDEGLISIRPREPGYNPIALTEGQADLIFWLTVVLYPLGIGLVGLLVVSRHGRWRVADLAAAGLGLVLALGVVGLLNFLGDRYHFRFDLTPQKLFTLAPDTEKLLRSVDDQDRYVRVKTFIPPAEGERFKDIMEEYKYRSRNFDYELLDPQKHAVEVRQYGIREAGTSLVEMSGNGKVHTERITEQTEEALSNAVQRALQAEDRKAYFTSGHQEGDLTQVDGEGYSILNGRLKETNLRVETGLQVAVDGVPQDATVLVVLGPRRPFAPAEAEAIREYLRRGRSALFLLDPGPPTGLEGVLDDYSVELGQDFVVDLSGIGQLLGADVSVPVAIQYGQHPITGKIAPGTMSFYPLARSVSVAAHRRLRPEVTALVSTSRSSWGETDLGPIAGGSGGKVEFDPLRDRRGPISMAVAAKAEADTGAEGANKTRLVVFGDSDFARNQYFGQQANGELLVGSVAWLAEGEGTLSIPRKEPRHNPINLVGGEGLFILWVSVFILPFAVALSGLLIMLRRGYATYAPGFLSWLLYSAIGAGLFFFAQGIIGVSEGSVARGEGYLLVALLAAAVSYGLHRRDGRVWLPALGLTALNAGLAFVAIPQHTLTLLYVQLMYAGLWVVNGVILVWIRKTFTS
jgi:ABC-type uncharacterized transport system involved in gliding motility auxiliary subunit